MTNKFTTHQQLIVNDPDTGRKLNIKPIFDFLNMLDPVGINDDGTTQISTLLDELVIRKLNEDSSIKRDLVSGDMFWLLYQIKDVFRLMHA